MTRFWVIAPYNSTKAEIFDEAWKYDLNNKTIAIGWNSLGNISQLNKAHLESKYRNVLGGNVSKGTATRDINALWDFYHTIAPGDRIIARRGTKRIVGIGTVIGSPFYDEEKGKQRINNLTDDFCSNFIPVEWKENPVTFNEIMFSFYTIYDIPEEKYLLLIKGQEIDETDEEEIGFSAEFVLEKYLEDFIVSNFERIFGRQLVLYTDPEGNSGQQYPTISSNGSIIGKIDILAREPAKNRYVIIELKKGRESDQVVGQTLRYIGWVNENLCKENEGVEGLIICKEVDEKLRFAISPVRDMIKVKLYKMDFRLTDP